MQRFEIPETAEMLLVKFQTRNENHGEAKVTAQDTRVRWQTKNTALDMLHPQLRDALCSAMPDQATDQGEMNFEATDLAFVRFKTLSYPLRWDRELTGYTMHVDYGTGGDSDMVVKVCKIHKFDLTPVEGGLVDIEFTISSSADIEERFVGKMGLLQQQNVFIRLLGPNLVPGDVIDASNGSGAPGTNGAAGETESTAGETKAKKSGTQDRNSDATQAFIAAHGTPTTH